MALAVSVFVFTSALTAQEMSMTLAAVNGKTGKPLTHQRLLVFMGNSQKDVRFHKYSQDVTTDGQGYAALKISKSTVEWLQVFVDYKTLCQTGPNQRSFNVAKILAAGEATPNDCGSFRKELTPNQLVIFARPATLRERKAW